MLNLNLLPAPGLYAKAAPTTPGPAQAQPSTDIPADGRRFQTHHCTGMACRTSLTPTAPCADRFTSDCEAQSPAPLAGKRGGRTRSANAPTRIGKPCRIALIMAVADTAEQNHVGGAAAESIMTPAETFNRAVDIVLALKKESLFFYPE